MRPIRHDQEIPLHTVPIRKVYSNARGGGGVVRDLLVESDVGGAGAFVEDFLEVCTGDGAGAGFDLE